MNLYDKNDSSTVTETNYVVRDRLSPLMTVDEVAAYLNLTPSTVYRMVSRKELPALRIGVAGRTVRFHRKDILQWVSNISSEGLKGSDSSKQSSANDCDLFSDLSALPLGF